MQLQQNMTFSCFGAVGPLDVNNTRKIMFSLKKTLTPHNEVILGNDVFERMNKAKFLGVIVGQQLN